MTEWSKHVHRFAKKHNMSYKKANVSRKCKEAYRKRKTSPKRKRKSTRKRLNANDPGDGAGGDYGGTVQVIDQMINDPDYFSSHDHGTGAD